MDFSFSETQNILISSAKNFLEKETKGLARKLEKTYEGYSPDLWQKMAKLGWMGLIFPEKYGGFDGNFLDLVLVVEEMGKALVPGPFIPTIISGLSILQYGNESQKEEILPELIKGKLILTYALSEPEPFIDEIKNEEQVTFENGSYKLSGTRLFSPFGHVANYFIYFADKNIGKTLFLVDSKILGLSCTPIDSIADEKFYEISLDKVHVFEANILGEVGKATKIVNKLEEWGAILESAFIIGMLERVLKMTVAYVKEREQFQKKIGTFQAIQHQCADMATDIDQAKFLTYQAGWKLKEKIEAKKEISMAKAWASDASRRVCLLGIKTHGGTGVSQEHDMQLYYRKAKAAEQAFGDGEFHRKIVAEHLGLFERDFHYNHRIFSEI